MNALFELVWRQWDRKISEIENRAGLSATKTPADESAKEAVVDAPEVRYLNDIVRQNISEMKELRLTLAEMTVANDKLGRQLGRMSEQRKISRTRMTLLMKKYKKQLSELKHETAFLKCETRINPERVKDMCERTETLEKKLTLKEEEIGRLYSMVQAYEQEKLALSNELDIAQAENRMRSMKQVFYKTKAPRSSVKNSINKWLGKPIVDLRIE